MKLIWQVDKKDVKNAKNFYNENKDNDFVKDRKKKNILKENIILTHESFWRSLVVALLTTQQRSGPDSPITKFLQIDPFPLNLTECKKHDDIKEFVINILRKFGGIRRYKNIAKEMKYNLNLLEKNNWKLVNEIFDKLLDNDDKVVERKYADKIRDNLKGFGPKQSRGLLLDIGLTKYETPLDSRVTKWLNKFGFPVKLSAKALQDINYYHFVMDGFQVLCKESNVYPCMMDAAIFTSYDEGW